MYRLKSKISQKQIKGIICQAFSGKEKVQKITQLYGGLFNTTYKVCLSSKKTVVLRVGPEEKKALLLHEKGLLKREVHIARELTLKDLPVPSILYRDFSRRILRRDFILAEYCEGANWHCAQKRLSEKENTSLYFELGSLAARIHSVKNKRKSFGLPCPFRLQPCWSDVIEKLVILVSRDMKDHSLKIMPKHIHPESLLSRMRPAFDQIKEPCLLHGDLWPRNILIQKEKGAYRIGALLDCERGLWGDKDFEWVFHCWNMPFSFWRGYGGKGIMTRERRMRHLFYRGYYLLVASLEERLHFQKKISHLRLFDMAEKSFQKCERYSV